MLVSAVVAGAAGVGVVARMGWRQTVGKLSPKQRAALREEEARASEPADPEDPVESPAQTP